MSIYKEVMRLDSGGKNMAAENTEENEIKFQRQFKLGEFPENSE